MSSKRLKLSSPAIQTREEMEALIGKICEQTILQDALLAAMDGELKKVRENYEDELCTTQKSLDGNLALAQDWAEAHPSEFGNRKSIEMLHGLVGWRTGMPKLRTLSGWNWDRVLEAIKGIPKFAKRFVRISEEVNKEAIISDWVILSGEAREFGVRVVQDETFYVEPKREEAAPTEIQQTKEAA